MFFRYTHVSGIDVSSRRNSYFGWFTRSLSFQNIRDFYVFFKVIVFGLSGAHFLSFGSPQRASEIDPDLPKQEFRCRVSACREKTSCFVEKSSFWKNMNFLWNLTPKNHKKSLTITNKIITVRWPLPACSALFKQVKQSSHATCCGTSMPPAEPWSGSPLRKAFVTVV